MPCTHGIPVGMMWGQTAAVPVDTPSNNPTYRQKLFKDMQAIYNPASALSSFIACDRIVREDIWFSTDTIARVIDRWTAFIEAARAANAAHAGSTVSEGTCHPKRNRFMVIARPAYSRRSK